MKPANVCLALLLAPATAGILSLTGCGSAPQTQNEKITLTEEGDQKLKQLERDYPDLKTLVDNSYGYAMFPSVAKGGAGIEVASGRGNVYQQGQFIGTAHLTLVNAGAVLGAETYAELIVFQTKDALAKFESNSTQFDAQAGATALKAGSAVQAKFNNGVAVFTSTNGGLDFDASIGGQQFTFTPAKIVPTAAPSDKPTTMPAGSGM